MGGTYERQDNFASEGDAEGEYHFAGSMIHLKYDFFPDFFASTDFESTRTFACKSGRSIAACCDAEGVPNLLLLK